MQNAMDREDWAVSGIAERQRKYPQFLPDFQEFIDREEKSLVQLERDGFYVRPNHMPRDDALDIGRRVDAIMACGKHIQAPRDLGGVKIDPDDYSLVGRISKHDYQKGLAVIRNRTHMVHVSDPLEHFPELLAIGLDEYILDLVGAYMGCLPSLSFLKITKSLANDLPPFDTQVFHIDGNAAKMVKAFLLLNDVDANTGPHMVVKNSHKERFDGCFEKLRWSEQEMISVYGKERLFKHFGLAGDLVVEDTSAFHCGAKPIKHDRTIVTFNYVPHEEYGGGGATLQAPNFLRNSLTEKQLSAADAIEFS